MATATTLTVINKALILCGASTISSTSEDSVNARAVNAVYETARQSFLVETLWSVATTRSSLATVATTTFAYLKSDENFIYSKPSGALRVIEVSDDTATYREEGAYIISDTVGLAVRYIYDHTEVGLWPPKMVEAFTDKLVSDVAFLILNSTSKGEAALAKYTKISLPDAMATNAQSGVQQTVKDGAWTDVKGGSGNPARSYD